MPGNEFEERDTGDGILKGVSHHSRPQALAEVGKYSKERAEYGDDNHHSRPLITMAEAENRRRGHDPNHRILRERAKLALQVRGK